MCWWLEPDVDDAFLVPMAGVKSGENTRAHCAEKVCVLPKSVAENMDGKIFLKNIAKKFGGTKKCTYICSVLFN